MSRQAFEMSPILDERFRLLTSFEGTSGWSPANQNPVTRGEKGQAKRRACKRPRGEFMNASLLSDSRYVLYQFARTLRSSIVTAILLVICPLTPAWADQSGLRTYGDPSLRTAVDAQTKRIYDVASGPSSQRIFVITRGNPMRVKEARGTEVTGTVAEGAISRIVATVWTKEGKYSVEFYRAGKTLLMVYETFTFFEESAPLGAWRNFMGLAAWERHVYFDSQQNIGYAEARGLRAPAPGVGGKQLQERAQRLAQLLQER